MNKPDPTPAEIAARAAAIRAEWTELEERRRNASAATLDPERLIPIVRCEVEEPEEC